MLAATQPTYVGVTSPKVEAVDQVGVATKQAVLGNAHGGHDCTLCWIRSGIQQENDEIRI